VGTVGSGVGDDGLVGAAVDVATVAVVVAVVACGFESSLPEHALNARSAAASGMMDRVRNIAALQRVTFSTSPASSWFPPIYTSNNGRRVPGGRARWPFDAGQPGMA